MRTIVLLLLALTYVNSVTAREFTDALMVLTPNGSIKTNSDFSEFTIIDDDTTNINDWVFNDFAVSGDGQYYVTTGEGVSISRHSGVSWDNYLPGNGLVGVGDELTSIAARYTPSGNWVLVGSQGEGISFSMDNGGTFATYNTANDGLAGDNINSVAMDKNGTLYIATDTGLSLGWDAQNTLFFENHTTMEGLPSDDIRQVLVQDTAQGSNMYLATSNGVSFSSDGFVFSNSLAGYSVSSIAVHKGVWYAGVTGVAGGNGEAAGLYISIDQGATYTHRSVNSGRSVWNVEVTDLAIYAGTLEGVAVSKDGGENFTFYTTENSALTHSTINGIVALGNTSIQMVAKRRGLAISKNSGLTFTAYDSNTAGIESDSITSLKQIEADTFVITTENGLSITTDFADNWSAKLSGISLTSSDYNSELNKLVIGSLNSGIFISSDKGQSFTNLTTANGLLSDFITAVKFSSDGTLYVSHRTDRDDGMTLSGISITADLGANFVTYALYDNDDIFDDRGGPALDVNHLVLNADNDVFIATDRGLKVSTDQLASFTTYLAEFEVVSMTLKNADTWYVATLEGLMITENGGVSFDTFTDNEGLPETEVQHITLDENELVYLSTHSGFAHFVEGGIHVQEINTNDTVTGYISNEINESIVFAYQALDADNDGFADKIDTDDDNDGVLDVNDAFPLDVNESVDTDGDGTGNNADTDDDGDGVIDTQDFYPLIALGDLTDTDDDGIPNICDQACLDLGMEVDTYPSGIIYVNDNSTCDAVNDTCGVTWDSAFPFLQDALVVATVNNNIWVAQGVYYTDDNAEGDLNGNRQSSFVLVNRVGIYGGFNDDNSATQLSDANPDAFITVLSGDINQDDTVDIDGITQSYTDVVYTNAALIVRDSVDVFSFTLQGFTITAGSAFSQDDSGGINLDYAGGTLKNLKIIGNKGFQGAALYSSARSENCSDMLIDNVLIKNNNEVADGVMLIDNPECDSFEINQLTMEGNDGAANLTVNSSLPITFNYLKIVDNDANEDALYFDGGNTGVLTINHGLITTSSNALSFDKASVNLNNITLNNNKTAISTEVSSINNIVADHLTIVGNMNNAGSAAIHLFNNDSLTLKNSIISGNLNNDIEKNITLSYSATLIDGGYNLIGNGGVSGVIGDSAQYFANYFTSGTSFIATQAINEIISETLEENNGWARSLMPVNGSALIDVIPSVSCTLSIDQRDQVRPYNNACDTGAIEVQLDSDNDSTEDFIDTDDDGDGTLDINDAFPLDASESVDSDGDGIGNNEDTDDDNDGITDEDDLDNDNDGVLDTDELARGSDPYNANDYIDLDLPVLTVPVDITVAATDSNGTDTVNENIALFLSLATASDNVDGILNVITHDAPDIFPLGNTQVTFNATDAAGNTGLNTAMVTVADETLPTMLLIGDESITINIGEEYNEQGANALDNVDGDVSNSIVITGLVDTTTLGLYTINYNVTDMAGNIATTISRNVSVQDSFAPVISVPLSIEVATTDNLGIAASNAQVAVFLNAASALDETDGVIDLVNNDAATTLTMGTHIITFSAMDLSGNTGFGQASITVSDLTAPVINLLGLTSQTLNVGDTYTDMGASALDNVDGDVSEHVVVSGNVDSSTVGIYNLTYDVTDNAGNNAVTEVRVITVQDMEAPVVTAPANITVAATDANGTDAINASISEFLNAARAQDTVDGEISTILNDAPITFALGVTSVVFSAQDSNGNTGFSQSSVTISDQTAPVMLLAGEENLLLNVGVDYQEQGASALDNVDGDISEKIVIAGLVDTTVPGLYIITYSVNDAAGNDVFLSRLVTVQDGSAPILTAPDDIVVNAEDASGVAITQQEITDFLNSVIAQDDVEGQITVISHDAPAIFSLGTTQVMFSASDSAGNTGFITANVTVVDTEVPVLNLNGANTINLELNQTYQELGATALDNVDGNITSQIIISNNVNTAFAGTYQVIYSVTDTSGNQSNITRNVEVVEEEEEVGIAAIPWSVLMMLLILMMRRRSIQ